MMSKRYLGTFILFAGIVLAWQMLHLIGGETALASPLATAVKLAVLLRSEVVWGHAAETAMAFTFALILGILGGVSLGRLYPGEESLANGLVVAVTETVADEDVAALADALGEALA